MDYRRWFFRHFDSNLTQWSCNFISKFLSWLLLFLKFFPRCLFQIYPRCVRIYYCATSLRNHRLSLIPHFDCVLSYGIYDYVHLMNWCYLTVSGTPTWTSSPLHNRWRRFNKACPVSPWTRDLAGKTSKMAARISATAGRVASGCDTSCRLW